MDGNLLFLNFEGLDDSQVEHLNDLLHPSNLSPEIEFPWTNSYEEDKISKGTVSSLNVHAPVFETYVSKISSHITDPHYSEAISFNNGPSQILNNSVPLVNYSHDYSTLSSRTIQQSSACSNGTLGQHTFDTYNNQSYHEAPKTVNRDVHPKVQPTKEYVPAANFKLNPAVSCFVPSKFPKKQTLSDGNHIPTVQPNDKNCNSPVTPNDCKSPVTPNDCKSPVTSNDCKSPVTFKDCNSPAIPKDCRSPVTSESAEDKKEELCVEKESVPQIKQNGIEQKVPQHSKTNDSNATVNAPKLEQISASPTAPRSWADIVSRGQRTSEKSASASNKTPIENGSKAPKITVKEQEVENLSVDEDKLALPLGKYLHQLSLNFQPVFLQPRGLINRRNWCYIHATLQALLACPPFYTLLRNLPLAEGLDREKSATPVIDSMMKMAQEFSHFDSPQEELQPGQPFQPDFIYDMLRDLKSDCLKGQQEDAEEFLSFILNGMHEEMVKIIKNYEKKNHLNTTTEMKENGDLSEGEDEWQVIGSKHKGMVTRKVAEHKTPISDLLGGQIKSFLTTSGSKTSASIQPFFTLQLDIQSENVTSVSEALKEMTMKEPIQGYTCAKTKQEVEAYNHVALQKLPPILILHLKRFVYNKNGGCKKVMKKTDYPIELELSKDLFSSDVKKNHRIRLYKLFAVMYHDGEEAVKGHYISDVYNHGSQTWVRCDDRTISVVAEAQVLSHSPPRVPYLLFYQES